MIVDLTADMETEYEVVDCSMDANEHFEGKEKKESDNKKRSFEDAITTDVMIPITANRIDSSVKSIEFMVFGRPVPLQRHGMKNGRPYNPSANAQALFMTNCQQYMPQTPIKEAVEVNINFVFARPLDHFKNKDREAGLLKSQSAPKWLSTICGTNFYVLLF